MLTDKQIGFAIRKAYEKGAEGNDFQMLTAILLNMDDDFCGKSNEDFVKIFQTQGQKVSDRSITNWVAALKEKNIIGVIQNKHAHRRQIYIRGINKEVKFAFEPALEDMSEAQRKFKKAFPDRMVDCEVSSEVDIDLIIYEIQHSSQIQNNLKFMTLFSFCHKFYKRLIDGAWRDRDANVRKSSITGHTYTKEEMNSLMITMDRLDEIEI